MTPSKKAGVPPLVPVWIASRWRTGIIPRVWGQWNFGRKHWSVFSYGRSSFCGQLFTAEQAFTCPEKAAVAAENFRQQSIKLLKEQLARLENLTIVVDPEQENKKGLTLLSDTSPVPNSPDTKLH